MWLFDNARTDAGSSILKAAHEDGKIWLGGKPGEGSEFRIELEVCV